MAQENGVGANEVSILTGTTNLQFSLIHSSVMPDPNGTKFTVEVPSSQGRPHSQLEEDSFNHSQNTSNQTFKKMRTLLRLHFYSQFTHTLRKSL